MPQPQGTVWITVWSCTRCGREVGRGDTPPSLSVCPGCGASFHGSGPVPMRQAEKSDDTASNILAPLVAIVAGASLVTVAILSVYWLARRKPKPLADRYDGWPER